MNIITEHILTESPDKLSLLIKQVIRRSKTLLNNGGRSKQSSIVASTLLKQPVYAGPAANALFEVANVLKILTALVEDEGALSNAPEKILKLTRDAIGSNKILADELASSIGQLKQVEDSEDSDSSKEGNDSKEKEVSPSEKSLPENSKEGSNV
jgi:hypothetical protein